MGDYALTTSKLCKYYGQNQILENVTMSVPSKSIYGLVGENGAGKTTLFRILAGLSKPSSGTFSIMQSVSLQELSEARRRIGFMIEMPALYPDMTVLQNIFVQQIQYNGHKDFKLKEREDKPSSEWIRVEGTHEAIIQKHDFDLVQRLRRIDTRTSPKSDKVYLFSGILICGCCGCRMTRKTNRYKDKEYHYYYCPTGKKNGCTSSVMLKESDLIECVQDSLKGHIENVASLDALLSSISQERINRELAQEYAAQIRVNEKRVAQTEGFKAKLYENLVSGILTKEEFLSYKRKYNADIELFQKAIAEWNEKLTDVLENRSERNRWINHFMKFSTMEDIDRRAVMQLIRSIRVMGKDELHIEFNYQDEYQKAISLAEQIATKNEERMVG